MELVEVFLVGAVTALATGLGAIPVWFIGKDNAERLRPALWGVAAGVMGVASVVGLILPGLDEGSAGAMAAGIAVGVLFLLVARRYVHEHDVGFGGRQGANARLSLLVFGVLFVHSMPEGLAVGTAYASETAGLGLFVVVAISIHNIPEGTSIAIPMAADGFSRAKQFWAAVLTSAPQPVGAVIAYLLVDLVEGLLTPTFGFAAGAMLALVVVELVPQAFTRVTWQSATAGVLFGAAIMVALDAVLGV